MGSASYRNRNTYDPDNQKPRGFNALNKHMVRKIWDQILTHDDGQLGYGGTSTFGVGGQGSW